MSIEKRFAWSFMGFIIGTISIIVAVIIFFYSQKQSKIDFNLTIESEEDLIEIKEQIPDLKVIFNNEEITKSEKRIKILKFSINNMGNTILQDYYDKNQDLRIVFKNSQILSYKIIETNSEYLEKDLLVNQIKDSVKSNSLLLNKLIFEKNKYAKIKCFLIQPKNVDTTIVTFEGKIAGIEKIPIVYNYENNIKNKEKLEGFYIKLFIIGYFGFAVFLFLLMFLLVWFTNMANSRELIKFIKDKSDISADQIDIIKILIKSARLKRLVNRLLNNDYAIDLSEYANEYYKRTIIEKLLPIPRIIRKNTFIELPKSIFDYDGKMIILKRDNLDIIKEYIENKRSKA
jgi:hypothetical protein